MSFKLPIFIAVALVFVAVQPAEAYLDANTGSLLIQLIVGGVAGLALVGKLMWHRITGFFRSDDAEHDDH